MMRTHTNESRGKMRRAHLDNWAHRRSTGMVLAIDEPKEWCRLCERAVSAPVIDDEVMSVRPGGHALLKAGRIVRLVCAAAATPALLHLTEPAALHRVKKPEPPAVVESPVRLPTGGRNMQGMVVDIPPAAVRTRARTSACHEVHVQAVAAAAVGKAVRVPWPKETRKNMVSTMYRYAKVDGYTFHYQTDGDMLIVWLTKEGAKQ